ncbi:MAG TPA: FtsX-like permease family protein [Gaiellales bacterium]|jgi:ABC-type antimicrobial peptide transport system permease subunit
MFFLSYALAELRRRRGRTILTALGLAIGVGLVVTVNALSTGLDHAQQKVLAPLTGVGTDMSVTRPIRVTNNGSGAFGGLSQSQRNRLRGQLGPGPAVNFRNLKPGQKFDTDSFRATSQLSFPASEVKRIEGFAGVTAAAGSLTLTDTHVYGKAPKVRLQFGNPGSFGGSGGQNGQGGARFQGFGGKGIHFQSRTVTGIDQSRPDLAAVTPGQITKGRYFTSSSAYQAILSSSYASTNKLSVGSSVSFGGHAFRVVGIASSPLGGTPSDAYVKLAVLQRLAKYRGQITTVQVRAASTGAVGRVAREIKTGFSASQVTTAQDLANRVGGSLSDARNLSSKLGTALEIVGLAAAVLIACLLTLASVAKRVREIGTLKAVGWSQWQVVRQISGESLLQGLLGGVIGAAIGIAGAAAVNAVGWTLKATVPGSAAPARGPFGGGPFGFGQAAQVTSGSTLVKITTSTDLRLILAAVGLAVLGGLVAGAVGGSRAARLRPAAALRTVE